MEKYKVLFVCLGNICRSPSAEAVFKRLVHHQKLGDEITADSAGTSAYHEGEAADSRMIEHARNRSINITSVSRAIHQADIQFFDMVICMDDQNVYDLDSLLLNETDRDKIYKMTDFCRIEDFDQVPDPYYGGDQGFEKVLDILEDACEGLLELIKKKLGKAV